MESSGPGPRTGGRPPAPGPPGLSLDPADPSAAAQADAASRKGPGEGMEEGEEVGKHFRGIRGAAPDEWECLPPRVALALDLVHPVYAQVGE